MTIWKGAARPLSGGAIRQAAQTLGVEEAYIRAVWEVEASGSGFYRDGSLKRRFEPHKLPGAKTNWRDSLALPEAERTRQFNAAWARNQEAAADATSWGAPQIMGSNAEASGYPSALAMVRAMADSEDAHLSAFVRFVQSQGLATYLRAHDAYNFALRYNGSGQARKYAGLIEAAYRRHSGQQSPVVLRIGATGAAVRELQAALGVTVDGKFGPGTEAAVRRFQASAGLADDGVVGQQTWAALQSRRSAAPPPQAIQGDRIAQATQVTGLVTAGAGAVAAIGDALPEQAVTLLAGGAALAGLMALGAFLFLKVRRVA